MAPAVKGGKVVSGTPAPSAGGAAAAGSTAARSAGSQKREAAPPPPPPPPPPAEETAAPLAPTADSVSAPTQDSPALAYRAKLATARAAQPAPPPTLSSAMTRAAALPATLAAGAFGGPVGSLAALGVAGKMAKESYDTFMRSAAEIPQTTASLGERVRQKYGSDYGLQNVAELAQEYLPFAGARSAESRVVTTAPAKQQSRVSFPSRYVPGPSAEALQSVAAFRKYAESTARELADAEAAKKEQDAQVQAAVRSTTTSDADLKALAERSRQQTQYITDLRAGLLRAGFDDADIAALKAGETPSERR